MKLRALADRYWDLYHAVWHALDDSEQHADGERTIAAMDAKKLERLVRGESHPDRTKWNAANAPKRAGKKGAGK